MSTTNKQKIFFQFVSTYFFIIILVLACLFPIFSSLEEAEHEKAARSIHDYSEGVVRKLESDENILLHTTRNFYSDQELQKLYYEFDNLPEHILFYHMTQLQKRLKLYFQNIHGIHDVFVYIPKFDYILTQQYIFRNSSEFYQYVSFSSFNENNNWLKEKIHPSWNRNLQADNFTDLVNHGETIPVINQFFVFPMAGDANIQILVIITLDSKKIAKQLLLPNIQDRAYVTITDADGNTLSHIHPEYATSTNPSMYYPFTFTSAKGKHITVGVDNNYYLEIRNETRRSIFKSIGIAFIFSACAALFFSWNRSRPIERILDVLRKANMNGEENDQIARIEDSIINMITEIYQCKNTIKELDSMVTNSLLEQLFFGELANAKQESAVIQCFGTMPKSCIAVVLKPEPDTELTILKEKLLTAFQSMIEKVYIIHIHNDKIYMLISSTEESNEHLEQMLKTLRQSEYFTVKAGISNVITTIRAIKNGTRQAEHRLISGLEIQGIYLFTHTYSSKASQNLINVQILDALQHTLITGNQSSADKIINELFDNIRVKHTEPVELRQLFFSLRTVYSIVLNQFFIENEKSNKNVTEEIHLPDDLDEYSPDTVQNTFLSLNKAIHTYYQKYLIRSTRNKGVEILAYINENYKNPDLCACSIADHFNLSEKYIFQLVKSTCGETLNDKISKLRVEEAIRLLRSTNMNISEIAKRVGFSSSNSMYKVFIRIKGIPPSSYQKKSIKGELV